MADQRAGGIESGHHVKTHARSNSKSDAIGEPAVETRTVPSNSSSSDDLAHYDNATHGRKSSSAGNPRPATSSARGMSVPTPRGVSPDSRLSAKPQPLEPPVTKTTLSELDVNKIIHNPKLRHDINFDPELHFRPNVDGERGRKKQDKANQFWNALSEQLLMFVTNRGGFVVRYGNEEWCLPQLLRTAKEIIQTLVPQRDRALLDEGLNVELLMQQFDKGIADLEKLASWLSGILKLHCAPMRDEWVDEMHNQLSTGNRNNDITELVGGMRILLNVLEAMKLDVANHQIRCLRPVLIEDTVHFEIRFFSRKIHTGKLNVDAARLWYQNARVNAPVELQDPRNAYAQAFGETGVFFHAATKLILPSTPVEVPNSNACPNTFVFDEDRILKLRSDMHDTICLEICMRQFEDLEQMASFNLVTNTNFHAAQVSRPASYVGSDGGSSVSSFSSPRSSGYLGTIASANHATDDSADVRVRSRDLYNSLLALLHTAPPAARSLQRWQQLASPMALQILRYVHAPQVSLDDLEVVLLKKLTDIQGDAFREIETYFNSRLFQEVANRVKDFKSLSGVGLFTTATGGRMPMATGNLQHLRPLDNTETAAAGSRRDPRDEGGIEDMATRLAHLGMLHWRVWSTLVYAPELAPMQMPGDAAPVCGQATVDQLNRFAAEQTVTHG